MTLRNNNKGLTLIELLIVVIVVFLLGLIVFSTYSGIQQKSRNYNREVALNAVQKQLEAFYNQNEYYPNLNDLNNPKWRHDNMKNLPDSDLVDPLSNCDASVSACLSPQTKPKSYTYGAVQSDGFSGCNGKIGSSSDQYCAGYTLSATFEGTYNGASTYTLHNL